jgi:hypothetical protein
MTFNVARHNSIRTCSVVQKANVDVGIRRQSRSCDHQSLRLKEEGGRILACPRFCDEGSEISPTCSPHRPNINARRSIDTFLSKQNHIEMTSYQDWASS